MEDADAAVSLGSWDKKMQTTVKQTFYGVYMVFHPGASCVRFIGSLRFYNLELYISVHA